MRVPDPQFSSKLILAFGSIAVITLVFCTYAIVQISTSYSQVSDFHYPALVELIDLQNKTNEATQESFAYVISGHEAEKKEFESFVIQLPGMETKFRETARIDEDRDDRDEKSFERVSQFQREFITNARAMISEFEATGAVSSEMFDRFEQAVDQLSDELNDFVDHHQMGLESARADATANLYLTAWQLGFLALFALAATSVIAIALIRDFSNYRIQQEYSKSEIELIANRHKRILDAIPALVWISDRSKLCTDVNRSWTQYTGRPVEQDLGEGWTELIHEDDLPQTYQVYATAFDKRQEFTTEVRIRRFDGDYRWHLVCGVPRFGKHGKFAGYVGSCLDVTDKKSAEDRATRVGRILEQSLNEIYIFDVESLRFTQVNRGAANNIGYDSTEILELTPLDLKPEFDLPAFREMLRPLVSGELDVLSFETTHRRKNGSVYRADVHCRLAESEGKQSVVAIVIDVTQRKLAEETLSRRAIEFELLYKSVKIVDETSSFPDAIQKCIEIICEMTSSPVGHAYTYVNGNQSRLESADIWQLPADGRYDRLRELTTKMILGGRVGMPARILESGEPVWIENVQEDDHFVRRKVCTELGLKGAFSFAVRIKGETIAVLEFFSRNRLDKNDPLSFLVQSVGEQIGRVIERKETENLIRQQNERVSSELDKAKLELVRKTRLAAIGQMSSQIAHEMRNPLGAVHNAAFLLKSRVPSADPKLGEYLGLIENEVQTCNRIIDGLLNVTRGKEPLRRNVDVQQILQKAVSRYKLPAAVTCHLQCEPESLSIDVDEVQMVQVLGNLLDNAIDAVGDIGEILLDARIANDQTVISVSDSGSGIAIEDHTSVFDALHTTKTKGTGLGLSICRQIVERHGGTIELIDSSATGTRFEIQLPRQNRGQTQKRETGVVDSPL